MYLWKSIIIGAFSRLVTTEFILVISVESRIEHDEEYEEVERDVCSDDDIGCLSLIIQGLVYEFLKSMRSPGFEFPLQSVRVPGYGLSSP
jgi:hypothetical protein